MSSLSVKELLHNSTSYKTIHRPNSSSYTTFFADQPPYIESICDLPGAQDYPALRPGQSLAYNPPIIRLHSPSFRPLEDHQNPCANATTKFSTVLPASSLPPPSPDTDSDASPAKLSQYPQSFPPVSFISIQPTAISYTSRFSSLPDAYP